MHTAFSDTKGGSRAWLIWGLAALFYLYEFAVRVAPGVMVSDIQLRYHLDASQFGASMAAYYHVYAPMQILVGLLLDYFGARYLLVFATLCVAWGCFMPLWGDSAMVLTMARGVMGFGSAFAFIGAMYLATIWFPKNRLAFLSGLTTALGMAGAIAGEAPMAAVVNYLGWQHTFWYAGFMGMLVAAALYFAIPPHPAWEIAQREARLANKDEKSFFKGLWIVFKNPQCWVIGLIAFTLYAPLAVFADLWGTEYIRSICHVSEVKAAGASSMLYVGWLVGGPLAGVLSDKWGKRRTPLIGASFLTAITLAIFFSFTTLPVIWAYGLLFAVGVFSSMQVICFVANMEVSPHFARGTALAVTNMVVMLFGGFCQWLLGVGLNVLGERRQAGQCIEGDFSCTLLYSADDFRLVMLILPILAFCGFLLSFKMKETFKVEA